MTPNSLRNCPVSLCLCSCQWRDFCVSVYHILWQAASCRCLRNAFGMLGCKFQSQNKQGHANSHCTPGGCPNRAVLSTNYVPYFPRCPSEPDAALWAAERVDYVEQSLQIGSGQRGDRSRPLGSLITRDSLSPALSLPLIPLSLL